MRLKYSIKDMKTIGETRGFECMSDVYLGIKSKLKWKCSHGHVWDSTPNSIKNGNGCPKCAHSKLRKTRQDMYFLASCRGFKFVSDDFVGMKKKHLWKCANGHIWHSTPENIRSGNNCPKCSGNITEEKIRFIFESLLNYSFPKNRSILKGLELDGFCNNLMLAFEYNGPQHYYSHFWNKDGRFLPDIIQRDEKKTAMCKELGITKINIPYSEVHLEQYVSKKLNNLGYKIHNQVNWKNFIGQPHKLKELDEIAKQNGGVLLSPAYDGSHKKHKWECSKEHKWEATAKDVKNGSWCPVCANNQKYSITTVRELALDKNFELLSEIYQGMNSTHSFRCLECKHTWDTRPNNIQQGRKCPYCGRKEE